jgi:aminomethyltransferase
MDTLNQLSLRSLHAEYGAKFVPYAGYDMPVQYATGVMAEHLYTREKAGLFDVSHMGQLLIPVAAAESLEQLIPADIIDLPVARQRYGLLTTKSGGVLDDLMIARREHDFFLVVNASRKAQDIQHLAQYIDDITVVIDRSLLALQGPLAEAALSRLIPSVSSLVFMDSIVLEWEGTELWVSRSGYTGEDGFEISVSNDRAEGLARALLAMEAVMPVGLGARDSLRMEAGMPLYGHELSEAISPVEASLTWAIPKIRRDGGARAGGFLGDDRVLRELEEGAPRRRVGLTPETRAPMRQGVKLYTSPEAAESVGAVTSGGFSPSLGAPISIALIDSGVDPEVTLYGEVRGKRLPVTQTKLPFHQPNYRRAS